MSELIKKPPNNPVAIGVNLEIGPKKDWSIYGGWVNPFEPINKGRLGSTQEWRIEKPKRHYY